MGETDDELEQCIAWAEENNSEKDGEIRRLQQACKAANGEVEKLKTMLANAAANAAKQSAAAAEASGGASEVVAHTQNACGRSTAQA